jgi:hypothetical protein
VHQGKQIAALDQESFLAIWNSPEKSVRERAEAVNRFIPRGTDSESMKVLVGYAQWNHCHGPSVDYKTGLAGSHDYWTLEYKGPSNEFVCLYFHQADPAKLVYLFDGASMGKRLNVFEGKTKTSK